MYPYINKELHFKHIILFKNLCMQKQIKSIPVPAKDEEGGF